MIPNRLEFGICRRKKKNLQEEERLHLKKWWFSLCRWNLHMILDVPRQWLMPIPKISLKDIRNLLNRHSRFLVHLQSAITTTSNPNHNLTVKNDLKDAREKNGFLNGDSLPSSPTPPPPQLDPSKIIATHLEELPLKERTLYGKDANDRNRSDIAPFFSYSSSSSIGSFKDYCYSS
ncbi:hypothetical protein U1Q18_007585 [Sarracenia purpurea var. burkii]